MNRKTQQWTAFAFGVTFVVVLLVIAVVFAEPTQFQYTVFRIVLALASAGVAAIVPGFLTSSLVSAGGQRRVRHPSRPVRLVRQNRM
jgi:uncharacterized integral membrane protein